MTHKGKLTPLGVKDPDAHEAAVEAFRRLLAGDIPVRNPGLVPDSPTVPEAAAAYLADCRRRASIYGKPKLASIRNYRIVLDQFSAAFSGVQISRLTADQVEEWVYARPWSRSYQNDAVGVLGALLRFHKVTLTLRKPSKESRGAETCLTEDQFDLLIHDLTEPGRGRKTGDLALLLRILRETGARPGEGCRLTVENVDWANCCHLWREHKTRDQTGRPRTIYFNSAAMVILQGQRSRYGSGLLFRTRNGNAYKSTELWEVLGKASKRLGFRVIAYGLGRHGFATNLLAAGVSDAIVAELLGQKGTKMITNHYGHLNQRSQALKAAAELASRR